MVESVKNLLLSAKNKDIEAVRKLFDFYEPLLKANAIVEDVFDEDLYQELCIVLLNCIQQFEF